MLIKGSNFQGWLFSKPYVVLMVVILFQVMHWIVYFLYFSFLLFALQGGFDAWTLEIVESTTVYGRYDRLPIFW